MLQVGAPAGVQIHPRDLHEPDVPHMALRQAPAPHGLPGVALGIHPAGPHRAGGPNLGGDGLLQAGPVAEAEGRHGQLHITDLLPQVEGHGGPAKAVLGQGCE